MRYFLEVSYRGTNYAGFQIQKNANSIQAEVEKALFVFFRQQFPLTGSSRTDSGVHALQNYFHTDTNIVIPPSAIYNINSILPGDIVLKSIIQVSDQSHCRFDAISREYQYFIYSSKNPFISDRAWYYPYPLNMAILQEAAALIKGNKNFWIFSKRKTQVKNYQCIITESKWIENGEQIIYCVRANRFLRGMVKALVATMLKVGRGNISLVDLEEIIRTNNINQIDFSAPSHGLFLTGVEYTPGIFVL